MILSTSTWDEVSKFIDQSTIAILPLGANEQHGMHLPVNNDIFCAEQFARKVLERAGDSLKLLLLPSIPYGLSEAHMHFPGTITLKAETFRAVVREIITSGTRHGIGRFAIINGHGGNSATLNSTIQDVSVETGRPILLINWWEIGADLIRDNFGYVFHACETETSVAMALGQRTLMEKAKGTKPERRFQYLEYNLGGGGPRVQAPLLAIEKLSETGSVGEPTKASVEKGRAIADEIVERIVSLLREFSKEEMMKGSTK